jgi:hypothetical protein
MFRQDKAEQTLDRATNDLLVKREVAAKLKKSPRTIDAYMRQGKLPYIKLGKSVLFNWRDVLDSLNRYRIN